MDHRKVKLLTIDFTEGVTLQPFIITTQAIESQKQMIMWFAENLGVLNEKRCKHICLELDAVISDLKM